MSFAPQRDGHIIWNYMHICAANAVTEEKRKHYVDWLNSQKIVFPCEVCRIHLISNLEELPVEPYMKSNISLFYHSWKLHDTVNGQLHKPMENRLTYPQAFEKYFGKSPATLQEETNKQASTVQPSQQVQHNDQSRYQPASHQEPSSRIESGTQNYQTDQSQRFMARAGHSQTYQSHSSEQSSHGQVCQTCGKVRVENGPKVDYDKFRQGRRKIYSSKN